MKKYQHRVEKARATTPPAPLPKEVVPVGAREYMDRWGERYCVIWNDQPADPELSALSVNVLK